jgi:hypothetical protein
MYRRFQKIWKNVFPSIVIQNTSNWNALAMPICKCVVHDVWSCFMLGCPKEKCSMFLIMIISFFVIIKANQTQSTIEIVYSF